MSQTAREQIFIGLMSGTSLDGLDAIAVDLSTAPRILATYYQAYSQPLRQQISTLCQGCDDELQLYAELDHHLGLEFAHAATAVIAKAGLTAQQVNAIGSHGQTVRHYPNHPYPNSLQMGDPNIIAQHTGITTVADFRRRDMAAGGQGAPLVPAFHEAAFRSTTHDRIIVNIGGIANLTLLPAIRSKPVTGWDTGPGNTLMNAWIFQQQNKTQDKDGLWARQGICNKALLDALMTDSYFSQVAPKSTGPEYFNLPWLDQYVSAFPDTPVNIQATLCALSSLSITTAITHSPMDMPEIYICGGGNHNIHLMQQIHEQLPDYPINNTQALDIDPDWVEATAFAWLAQQTINGKTGNLPAVTGAHQAAVLGGIYPA